MSTGEQKLHLMLQEINLEREVKTCLEWEQRVEVHLKRDAGPCRLSGWRRHVVQRV